MFPRSAYAFLLNKNITMVPFGPAPSLNGHNKFIAIRLIKSSALLDCAK